MNLTTLSILFIAIPLGLGTYSLLQRDRVTFMSILLALMPLCAGIALWSATYACAAGPLFDWNAGKIAPVVASLSDQYRLYEDPNTGVMTAWIYGPVPAMLFAPVALFHSPTDVIIAAVAINAIVTLAPVIWLHLRNARKDWSIALVTAALFLWFCLTHESVRRVTFMVTPDGPALAFATAAIVLLMGQRFDLRISFVVAVCVTLSIWCKQTMLPIAILPIVYIACSQGRPGVIRYIAVFTIVFSAISAIFILTIGAANMRFHMITLPASHPWRDESDGRLVVMFRALVDLIRDAWLPLVAVLVVAAIALHQRKLRRLAMNTGWYLLPFAALLLVPSSILGYVKVGGFINNFALTEFFLALAATSGVIILIRESSTRVAKTVRVVTCCAVLTYAGRIAIVRHELPAMASRIANPYTNQQEVAYRFAKAHPGIAYFPWNPLSTWLVENRLYHFEWGYVDRRDAGMLPSETQIRAHVPERVLAVAVPSDAQSDNAVQMFPGAKPSRPAPELPGFDVFDVRAATRSE